MSAPQTRTRAMLLASVALITLTPTLAVAASQTDRVTIPAGPFAMGCSSNDPNCDKDEGPQGGTSVMVPAFKIDRNEVTVAQYQACIDSGACTPPKDHNTNKYCNLGAPGRDNHPINCVDWSQALAYCQAHDGRLPKEAEWEKAARAGSTSAYPWGNKVSCKQAILDPISPAPSEREPDGCYTDATWPVASRPANAWGLYDMNGNAGEWTANWYAPDAITALYAQGQLDQPTQGRQRVARGGSWDENQANLRSSFRNVKPPEQGRAIYGSIGFRCAAD